MSAAEVFDARRARRVCAYRNDLSSGELIRSSKEKTGTFAYSACLVIFRRTPTHISVTKRDDPP